MTQAATGTVGFQTASGRNVAFKSAKAAKPVSDAEAAVAANIGGPAANPINKLANVIRYARTQLVGRDDLLWDIALGLVSGKNALFIGPPGTAKTYAVDLVAESFCDRSEMFSILLTRFTKPQEVFGPLSLTAFKEGRVEHNMHGYLPAARVGVLDEIFKASSAILNSMLGIANERRFRNGSHYVQCPTRMLVGMSNEFPEDPALLAAFFDRFPIKRMVGYLQPKDFETMLRVSADGVETTPPEPLTDADFAEIDRLVGEVHVSDEILLSLSDLRSKLKSKGVQVSDRRWVQAVQVMRAGAVLGKRAEVHTRDFRHLASVLWNAEADIPIVNDVLQQFVSPIERECNDILAEANAERLKIINAATGNGSVPLAQGNTSAAADAASKAANRIKGIAAKLDVLKRNNPNAAAKDLEIIGLATVAVQQLEATVRAVGQGTAGLAKLQDVVEGGKSS